ncbi:aconitate hydratase 1 [Diplodia corticola]|uniref:Aconitate hydratase 1 n=1 Tax=Diplodia corticola TaxID=236234 RepID=A0A1J9SA81_9PEZI|nr:aconitate hydratase 1 [Diplodia corticola]OJD37391.1 aconitate hydratase 1 [Diplodia corticola]
MVLVKRKCPPERRKAVIAVRATASSPTLSVGATPPQHFSIRISLRIAQTTRPGEAITIATTGTVFEGCATARGSDPLAQRRGSLVATAAPTADAGSQQPRAINLGGLIVRKARAAEMPDQDLKEKPGTRLLTIPAEGSVEVAHDLPVDRIFLHERKLREEDVVGEEWRFRFHDGWVGTTWWCWGDLEGEGEGGLREKRLSCWHEGMALWGHAKPDVGDGWVLGLDPAELVFEVEEEGSEFRFVE